MRNEGGYSQIFFPDGRMRTTADLNGKRVNINGAMLETSTFTCFHCNTVVHVLPKSDVNSVGFCKKCMKPICQKCASLPCIPFERQLEEIEAKGGIRDRPGYF